MAIQCAEAQTPTAAKLGASHAAAHKLRYQLPNFRAGAAAARRRFLFFIHPATSPQTLVVEKVCLPSRLQFDNPFGAGTFAAEIREQYIEMYRDPVRVRAVCEEYRAAATIDVEHDRKDSDAKHQIKCPMLHLWAAGGPLDTFYSNVGGSLGIWRQWASNVQGQAMKGGHFFPEENPIDTAEQLESFLLG